MDRAAMVRLNVHTLLIAGLATTLAGCFQSTRVASVDRAIAMSKTSGPTPVHPQAGAADADPSLTLEVALDLAMAHDPGLAELRANTAAASARVAAASDIDNPELRWTNVDFGNGGDASALALRARPPLPGAVQAKGQIASARLAQAGAEAARGRQILGSRVRRLFAETLLHQRANELAIEAATLESSQLALVDRELAQGLITRVAAAEMTLDSARARGDAERIARRLSESRDMLWSLCDLPAGTGVVVAGELPDPSAVSKLASADQELVQRALRDRPEVLSAGAAIDAARAETWIERSRQWPWFSFVQIGYDFQPSGVEAWEAGVAVDVPLFNLHRDDVRAAEADGVAARRAFEATVRDVSADVGRGLARVRTAASELARFRDGAAIAAESAYRAAARARSAGQANDRDLLEAQSRYLEARISELELMEEYIVTYSRLRAAVGEVDPAPRGAD